jgi:hypothetical protein
LAIGSLSSLSLKRSAPDVCLLVQAALPVCRHAPLWSGCRLIERMVLGRGEWRAVVELLGAIVPIPVLLGHALSNARGSLGDVGVIRLGSDQCGAVAVM